MDVSSFLETLAGTSREKFISERRVLSFDQYLSLFLERPALLGRNAPQYLLDILDFYGKSELKSPSGSRTRSALFDAPFDGGRDRLVGQEEVQEDFYRVLSDFVREGKASRLILLHGPNGSAKTSFVQCLARAMVRYSRTEDGTLYTFNWVFPKSSYQGKRLGFKSGSEGPPPLADTYAFLEEKDIAARLPAELGGHPLLLLPREERERLLDELEAGGTLPAGFRFADHLQLGDLAPISKRIFDALLAAYEGDLSRVLAHVQVERFYFSRRYRKGIVTVEPQMHVDAAIRQITMDESYSTLPPVLRHVPMFQVSGDLVDANRGMVEFSDMLKRPVDAFKYLLGTCETGRIHLGGAIVYLDIVFAGTTNDNYVQAFAKAPDFSSFKGRMELVRVPYIRDYRVEQQIYDIQVTSTVVGRHVAPHATLVASLWAVLTRMRKCDPEAGYAKALTEVVAKLSPLEKADLYATGTPPSGLKAEVARELVQAVPRIHDETRSSANYEGSFGASPREAKGVLLAAAHAPGFECLHPVRVFVEIEELIKHKSLYEFLQYPADGEYHDATALLGRVRERYAHLVEGEFKRAMGMVTEGEFEKLLQKYAAHASAFLKGEKVLHPITRDQAPPDEEFMGDLERRWEFKDRKRARQDFLGRIASFSLDNPGVPPDFGILFADQLESLKTAYYEEHKSEIERSLHLLLDHLDGANLSDSESAAAQGIIDEMCARFGYCRACIGPALTFLSLSKR
jgi:serine protein kinase